MAFASGCFEGNEDELDSSVADATPTCTDGEVQACEVEEGCIGTQTCTDGIFGDCQTPAEICDGVDNDCDGVVDNGFAGLGEACEAGDGACLDKGTNVCSADGSEVVCDATPGDGTDEVCDGIDNDCNGEIDDGVEVGVECDTGLPGVCGAGTTTCDGGDTVCVPAVEPGEEICDGLDNDCDGRADEDGVGGVLAESCYDGPEGTEGQGACAAGVRLCVDGAFGECADQVVPGAEICDGVDNDCDGEIDNGDAECVCTPGEVSPCYTGPEGTDGVGACTAGVQTCLEDGSGYGACESEVVPGAELCDGLDNDCDGEIDNAPGVGGPCAAGEGACAAEGTLACDVGTGQVVCDAEPGLPGEEICDGQDNDCDGVIDDVPGAGEPCDRGQGECLGRGILVCPKGDGVGLICNAIQGAPGEEICDGRDNDCNGIVDDAPGVGEDCEAGQGVCRSTGITVCDFDSGEVVCPATAQAPQRAEFCGNGADDDCDGEADEDECIIPCDVDDECGPRTLCIDGACIPADCRGDDDCAPGEELCIDNFCRPGDCRDDAECPEGESCIENLCSPPPAACTDTPTIDEFGTTEGSTVEAPSEVGATCAGGAGSPENAYTLNLAYDGTICIDTYGSSYDTSLYVRTDCLDPASEIACNDDAGSLQSQIQLDVTADGSYVVFVDGFSTGRSGDYLLQVREGACDVCQDDGDCPGANRCVDGACVDAACGDGDRGFNEGCDDGNNENGDGCSADCQIEEGFDCIEPDIAPIRFEIDGVENCGVPPENPVELDVPAWPVYRLHYVSGAIANVPGMQNGNAAVWVGEEPFVRLLASEIGTPPTVEEAEALYAGLRTEPFPVPEGAPVIAGFPDAVCDDNAGSMVAELRAADFCFDNSCLADADCDEGLICIDGACQEAPDFDGDGIDDLRDADDDNDGIPDALECFAADAGQITVINGSLELPPIGAGQVRQTPQDQVPGWQTTEAAGSIEMWGDGFQGTPAAVGNAFAEINANEADGALYQDVATVPGTTFVWSFFHRGRLGEDELELRVGPPDATVSIANAVTGNGEWRRYTGTYTVPEGQALTRFEFRSIRSTGGAGVGNFIDGVEFTPICPPDADADGDGQPNALDLDADGDGVPDAEEAGHGLPHTDGVVDGEVGSNGLNDGVETAPDSGEINYELVDRDADGIFDFLQDGPFFCGNGVLDEGEGCDDGNRDAGDGCDDACQVEEDFECTPPGIGECAEGQPVETASLQAGDLLPAIGGQGGGPFNDECAPGEVVIGFNYAFGGGFNNNVYITQSQAICARFDVTPEGIELTETGVTPLRGGTPNEITPARCAPGSVVTGFVGHEAEGFVSGVQVYCSGIRVEEGAVVIGQPEALGFIGRAANASELRNCGPGQIVGGNAGRDGAIIDNFTMRCYDVVAACRNDSICDYVGEGCFDDGDCEAGQLCRGRECVQTGLCPDDDEWEPNDDIESATPIMAGRYEGLAVCGNDDFFTTELCAGGTATIDIYFIDADGDVDLRQVPEGPASTSTSDDERIVIVNEGDAQPVSWRVYGFSGAQNTYAMDVAIECPVVCPDGAAGEPCPEGFDEVGPLACELVDEQPAVANGVIYDVCRGPENAAYGSAGVTLPGGQVINGGFFGEGAAGSRLNTSGVWACGPDGVNVGPEPVNEQIGFSSRIDIAEGGEYVLGLGADDNLVATVDGVEVLRRNGAFQSWYLVPVQLSAGSHIILLEGVNTGGPGVFGAEVYGPFPAGSTADDASLAGLDYENNVVFTSLERVGGVFDTGVNSGFSCPDGYDLDVSGAEPVCVQFERFDRCERPCIEEEWESGEGEPNLIEPGIYDGNLCPGDEQDGALVELCPGGTLTVNLTVDPDAPPVGLLMGYIEEEGPRVEQQTEGGTASGQIVNDIGAPAGVFVVAGEPGTYEVEVIVEGCDGPVEICDNGEDDDGDGDIDCLDADCAQDEACAVVRTIYASMPSQNGDPTPTAPTRLYALDSAGNTQNLGDIILGGGEPAVVTAIALSPDSALFGFHYDAGAETSLPVLIDPATLVAQPLGPPVPGWIHGAGFGPDGTLWVANRTTQGVHPFGPEGLGPVVLAYPELMEGADIAFDADGNCFLTGVALAGANNQRPLYSCDLEAGTTEVIGPVAGEGFGENGGVFVSALTFALPSDTCESTLFGVDGAGIDELGAFDFGVQPPPFDQIGSLGVNYSWFTNPDAAGFPSVINTPGCDGPQPDCAIDADCGVGELCRAGECIARGLCPDDDGFESNDGQGEATAVMAGRYEDLAVCGNDDWFTTELCAGGTMTIDLYFIDDEGDIDLQVFDGPNSTSSTDDERSVVDNSGQPARAVDIRVYGFSGAQNAYAMDIAIDNCAVIEAEICDDGVDNDVDGATDCDDVDCVLDAACFCGNGELDEGEACDDGNTDAGDGCGADCQVEEGFDCQPPALGECQPGQEAETVTTIPGDNLPALGGDGGSAFDDRCAAGEVVIGFDFAVGPWGGVPGETFITRSQAQCARIDVADGQVFLTPTQLTPVRGEINPIDDITRCPEGHAVSGYVGFDAGNANQRYVAGVGLVCSPLSIVDGAIVVGDPIEVEPVGNTANLIDRFDCAPGRLAGANVGRSGGIIDQFTVRCDDIAQSCRNPSECVELAVCGDGVQQPGEECDDNNLENGDGCDSFCTIEVQDVLAAISQFESQVAQDEDEEFLFTVYNDPTRIRAATGDGEGGCPGDTRLAVFPLDDEGVRGDRVLFNDDIVPGQICSILTGELAPGNYVLVLDGFGGRAFGPDEVVTTDVRLDVDVSAGGTFDGGLEEGGFSLFTLDLAEAVNVTLENTGAEGCPGDLFMRLYSIDGEGNRVEVETDDDDGDGLCSLIQRDLEPGSYEIEVEELGRNRAIPAFQLTVQVGEPRPPEVCDSGLDDDGNGQLDCADPACADDPACAPVLACAYDLDAAEVAAPFGSAGDAFWFADAGTFSSGDIGDNQVSSLFLRQELPAGGTIAFDYRVSSEPNFDWLEFYIDGVRIDRWSGASDFVTVQFDVDPGVHTFEWRYDKDGSVSSFEDRGQIDNIVFTEADLCPPPVAALTTDEVLTLMGPEGSCSGCHVGDFARSGGLNFDDFIADTVNVPSFDVPGMDFIEPGDHTQSYLWHKMNGSQGDVGGGGDRMPRFSPPLTPPWDQDTIDAFGAWIDGLPVE